MNSGDYVWHLFVLLVRFHAAASHSRYQYAHIDDWINGIAVAEADYESPAKDGGAAGTRSLRRPYRFRTPRLSTLVAFGNKLHSSYIAVLQEVTHRRHL